MKTRRGEPRRLGNVALLALMLCSVVALSLIRGRFAPIVTSAGDAIKSDAGINAGGDEAAAEAAAAGGEEKDKKHESAAAAGVAQQQPKDASAKPVCYETSRRSDTCEASGDVRVVGGAQTVYVDTLDREWRTKPYCRKHDAYALAHVKEWTLKPEAQICCCFV